MKHRTIDPVAIKELICLDFHIPSYQRGYRWTTQQIKELLEDIEYFCEKGAKGIYCIQPLVLKGHDRLELIGRIPMKFYRAKGEKTKPPLILHGQGAAHYVMQFRIIRLRTLLWEPL